MLNFDPNTAKQADQLNNQITQSGKYIGTITRAEKLLSQKGTQGLGLSFKTDAGETADYLDLYTINASNEVLPSMKTVQAILGCLGLREATDGNVTCEKYNADQRKRETVTVPGYPAIQGKRIGFLLQKELSTNSKNGKDVERMQIVGVFQADTELTVSEILARKTTPETLPKMLQALMLKPVRDSRKAAPQQSYSAPSSDAMAGFEDDIPF